MQVLDGCVPSSTRSLPLGIRTSPATKNIFVLQGIGNGEAARKPAMAAQSGRQVGVIRY
jgi:hypothetical protein